MSLIIPHLPGLIDPFFHFSPPPPRPPPSHVPSKRSRRGFQGFGEGSAAYGAGWRCDGGLRGRCRPRVRDRLYVPRFGRRRLARLLHVPCPFLFPVPCSLFRTAWSSTGAGAECARGAVSRARLPSYLRTPGSGLARLSP